MDIETVLEYGQKEAISFDSIPREKLSLVREIRALDSVALEEENFLYSLGINTLVLILERLKKEQANSEELANIVSNRTAFKNPFMKRFLISINDIEFANDIERSILEDRISESEVPSAKIVKKHKSNRVKSAALRKNIKEDKPIPVMKNGKRIGIIGHKSNWEGNPEKVKIRETMNFF